MRGGSSGSVITVGGGGILGIGTTVVGVCGGLVLILPGRSVIDR